MSDDRVLKMRMSKMRMLRMVENDREADGRARKWMLMLCGHDIRGKMTMMADGDKS